MEENRSSWIVGQLQDSAEVKMRTAAACLGDITRAAEILLETFRHGGKVLVCGNGGSAADAQHIAAEFMNKLVCDRAALPAIALTTDTSVLTSIGNDVTFSRVFARQVEALAREGDALIAISTTGNSVNVNEAVLCARQQGAKTIAFTGKDGGELARCSDVAIVIPSQSTQRIQEGHITVAHILCEIVEGGIFG